MLDNMSTKQIEEILHERKVSEGKSKPRYEITGIWSGYRPEQQRVAYLEYTLDKNFVENIRLLGNMVFTDNTTLNFSIRKMGFREKKKKTYTSYRKTIMECIAKGTNKIADLD